GERPERHRPGGECDSEVDDAEDRLHEGDVRKLLPGRAVGEGCDQPLPEAVALARLVGRLRDVLAEAEADADALRVRRRPGEIEGQGQDRESDDRDQEADACRDQGYEDGEPENAEGEVEE